MICPNCNTLLAEDAKFCHSCGTKLSDNIKNRRIAMHKKMKPVYQPRKELRAGGRKKWQILLPVAGLILTAVILTVFLIPYRQKTKDGFIYLKDGEFYYATVQSGNPIELTGDIHEGNQEDQYFEFRMNFLVKFNQDGNRVFYPGEISKLNGDIDLYFLELKEKSAKPKRIAKNIWNYEINDAGTRVYYINSENELYESNLSDEDRIATGVSYFVSGDDGNRLIWFDRDNNIYYKNEDGDGEKLDTITEFVYCTPDLKKIYYLKGDAVYLSVDGKKGEKILSGVTEVLKVYETGEIYYCHQNMEDKRLSDLVEDDMMESDRNVIVPNRPEYPSYHDCLPNMPVPEEPDWYDYTDRNGITDWSSYQADYDIYTTKIKNYNTEWDRLYQSAVEQYDRDYDAYDAAEVIYGKKKERDSLREALEQETFVISHGTLYYYDTDVSVIVSDSYKNVFSTAEEQPAIVYCSQNDSSIEKKRLSELTDIKEVNALVNGMDRSSMKFYAAIGAVPSEIKQVQGEYFRFDTGLNYLYYMDHYDPVEDSRELYQVPITDSRLGTPRLYDKSVSFYQILKGKASVLYFKNAEDTYGDLYLDRNRIDTDVQFRLLIPSEAGNGFYYIKDYNGNTSSGTLMYYNGRETKEISEDIYDYYVLNDQNVLYLKNYDPEECAGELFLYHGKETGIEEEVSMLLKHDKYFDYYLKDHYLTEK